MEKSLWIILFWILVKFLASSQTFVDFSTLPKSGTALVYTHHDEDLLWMLPWWNISEKFIDGVGFPKVGPVKIRV